MIVEVSTGLDRSCPALATLPVQGPSDGASHSPYQAHSQSIEAGSALEEQSLKLPCSVACFEADGPELQKELTGFLKAMGLPPRLTIRRGENQKVMFRIADAALLPTLARSLPAGVLLHGSGDTIPLPPAGEWQHPGDWERATADLSVLTEVEVSRIAKSDPGSTDPVVTSNPLLAHSLRGQSAAFRAKAVAAKPLLANLCLSGQVTTWYAAPNTGKTLIALNLLIEAIREKRIAAGNAFYINADDSSEGMATKMEMMDELGVHTIVPSFKGFVAAELAAMFHLMAERDQARGVFVLVDTTKKFAQLMDKKDSAAFGNACRQVAMNGGAVLNLAHTTKAPNADGTPRYAGTTDLVEDADAAYTIRQVDVPAEAGERVVEFRCFKQRGDSAESAAYAYAVERGLSYADRLASVRTVDEASLDEFRKVEEQRPDEEVVAVIRACIADGINAKMILSREAAARTNISRRAVTRLIEKYTGDDPVEHRWKYRIEARGAKVFELLPPPPD